MRGIFRCEDLLVCVFLCLALHVSSFVPLVRPLSRKRSFQFKSVPGADIEQPPVDRDESLADVASQSTDQSDIPVGTAGTMRAKVNEIDFCIAPADVSLSRAYGTAAPGSTADPADSVGLSLTRALNNASNRAVRRILLARSWPSAEALNSSLRQVAAMEAARQLEKAGSKCPVPRPILNVLTRNQQQQSSTNTESSAVKKAQPKPRSRTDEEYVADQLKSFQDLYGTLVGYAYAQDYLECILSLATAGVESEKVPAVLSSGIYDEAYKRVLSVLKTVGVQFENDPVTKRRKIAKRLTDQDICLSMIDKVQLRKEANEPQQKKESPTTVATKDLKETEEKDSSDKKEAKSGKKKGLKFWKKNELTSEDLGGVLLSAKEPTMTRQLNILSNVVQRALLFGGDQELLVLAETLDADLPAFVARWYPGKNLSKETEEEILPGVQYLNSLIELLRQCYDKGVVTNLDPSVKLLTSFSNSYERLVASSVELGSGYLRPSVGEREAGIESGVSLVTSMPKPRTAQEELGRFAVWESNFRQLAASSSTSASSQYSPYPQDLVGTWEVRDEIGGETIGVSEVTLMENGDVKVTAPLEGLRWRLDPGPTHLDTCTFQVLSTLDGTVLQYRGFIDRGARLEARFSKRSIKIRGSVMFQMRDGGSVDYYKDMLPINYRTGTTKFTMAKGDPSQ